MLLPGLYTFKIEFFGHLTEKYDENFFRNVSNRNTVTFLIAPHIQAIGMRQLFPCWDIPHLKATFTISIKHHRNLTTLSNMPIKYHSTNNLMSMEIEVWTHFYTTPPMSTFQIAIVVTEYQPIRISKNITLWCECYSAEQTLKFEFAQRIINNITLHLKSELSEINIPKMDHIAIPNFPQDGISKWGIIFHTTFSSIMSYNFWSMKEKLGEAYHCYTSLNEFSTWIQYKHYPVVSWKRITGSKVTNILSQSYNMSYSRWLIPINLKAISLNINYETCLTSHINSIKISLPQLLMDYWMVDIQHAGYYRVKYDSLTWDAIAKHLNDTAGDYESISIINRVKIIDDAFYLMMERQLNVSVFWNLAQFLSQETNFVVWYPMLKVLEYMSITLPLLKEEIEFFDTIEKFKKLLENPLKTLGYDEHLMENDLSKCLRQEIVKWACTLEYNECEQAARRKLQQHLQNPEINPLLPVWKHWTYCRGLATANSSTWSYVKDTWLKTRNHTLLPYLTCSGYGSFIDIASSSILERFTQDERQNITIIRLYIDIFHSIIMKHSNTYYILEQILSYLEILKPKQINILTALADIINHVYSSKKLKKVNKFNSNYIYQFLFRPGFISVRLILISVFY
ncbi:Aminopeptidase N [Trachymyrmex cornetzi]|uniref:Aminopeptidase N n=1 Tax=Trachymyrmex cornetzi TaxID=471704 RepID=A0A151J1C7_9HYME|nr:Aminopeptidase N [Trachymyrmex cornetzi]